MTNKEKLDYLLSDIQNLETLVKGLQQSNELPSQLLSRACSSAYSVLEKLKAIENEQIQQLNIRLGEQQEELNHLSVLLDQYKSLVENSKKNIEMAQHEMEEVEQQKPQLELQQSQTVEAKPVEPQVEEKPIIVAEPSTLPTPAPDPVPMEIPRQEVKESAVQAPAATTIGSKSGVSLHDMLEKQNLSDFRKAFSLNDRFRFRRDLFHGNENVMNRVVSDLNDLHTLAESKEYIESQLQWDLNDETVKDFIQLLEKRFI